MCVDIDGQAEQADVPQVSAAPRALPSLIQFKARFFGLVQTRERGANFRAGGCLPYFPVGLGSTSLIRWCSILDGLCFYADALLCYVFIGHDCSPCVALSPTNTGYSPLFQSLRQTYLRQFMTARQPDGELSERVCRGEGVKVDHRLTLDFAPAVSLADLIRRERGRFFSSPTGFCSVAVTTPVLLTSGCS